MYDTNTPLFSRSMIHSDLEHIRAYGQSTNTAMEAYVDDFYTWLRQQPNYLEFFGGDDAMLRRVAAFQDVHWHEFFSRMVDDAYVATHRATRSTEKLP